MSRSKRIVIVGATGLIGAKVSALARLAGHEVVAVSRGSGVDAVTGEGLEGAFAGADAVLDVSNIAAMDEETVIPFFRSVSENLVEAGVRAGTGHHVVLSIVGTDALTDQAYLRAKALQEEIVATSGRPYTVVRATQFFELLPTIVEGHAKVGIVHAPDGLFQPVAADEVAAALAEICVGPPADGIVEIGGPERAPFETILRAYMDLAGDRRPVRTDPGTAYFGQPIGERSLVPAADARLGTTTLQELFARR